MRVAGLFAGIGGFEVGLARAGHEIRLACELDPAARAVLSHRMPRIPAVVEDVRRLGRIPPDVELLVAGFPCVDLSAVGPKTGIQGLQSSLVREVFRLLEWKRVPTVVLENVPFMMHLRRGEALREVLEEFGRLRYRWAYRVVDAIAFGLPQRRQRVFIVASRDLDPRRILLSDSAPAPDPPPSPRRACGFYWTEGNRGLGWAEEALPPLKGGSGFGFPSPPAFWLKGRGAFTPEIRDAERLQGFRANWTVIAARQGRASHRWKLVGNSVSVRVAEWLGRRLARPGDYAHESDQLHGAAARLPAAGWSNGNGMMVAEGVTKWPAARARVPLTEWLRFQTRPLSPGGALGFVGRVRRSTLRVEQGFLEDLEAQAERGMRGGRSVLSARASRGIRFSYGRVSATRDPDSTSSDPGAEFAAIPPESSG